MRRSSNSVLHQAGRPKGDKSVSEPQTDWTFQLTLIESLSTAECFVYQTAARKPEMNPICSRTSTGGREKLNTRCVGRHGGRSGWANSLKMLEDGGNGKQKLWKGLLNFCEGPCSGVVICSGRRTLNHTQLKYSWLPNLNLSFNLAKIFKHPYFIKSVYHRSPKWLQKT